VTLLTQAMKQTMATEMIGLQALCLLSLGEAQLWGGLWEEARALAERALAHARPAGAACTDRDVLASAAGVLSLHRGATQRWVLLRHGEAWVMVKRRRHVRDNAPQRSIAGEGR
jgi:hypothetical protein